MPGFRPPRGAEAMIIYRLAFTYLMTFALGSAVRLMSTEERAETDKQPATKSKKDDRRATNKKADKGAADKDRERTPPPRPPRARLRAEGNGTGAKPEQEGSGAAAMEAEVAAV